MFVQEASKGGGTLAAAAAKTRGLSSECLSKMPPTPDGALQASDIDDEPLPYEPDYELRA